MHELIIMKKSARTAPRSTATSLKGLYARVARKMGCDSSYVSKVARGERRSRRIEIALRAELQLIVRRLLKRRTPARRQGDRGRHSTLA
jgi:hypothetical protein